MNSIIFQTLTQKLPQRILAKFGFGKNLSLHRKQSAKLSCVNELILSKFEACLLGALIGDCIGKKFEGIWGPNLGEMLDDYRLLKEKLEHLDQTQDSDTYNTSFESYLNENKRPYTDDTALTRALCESFINFGDFDLEYQASVFELAYSSDPNRGYSSGSIVMFKKLNKLKQANELEKKCLVPAMELFNGEGSYGNGGGMRCSAIALFTYPKTLEEMKIICEISTRLTHSHKWAIIGALQQCFALRQALQNTKSTRSFDFDSYFNSIITFVHDLERNYDSLDHFNSENIEMCSKSTQKSFLMYMEQKNELYKHKKKSNGHHKHHHHHHHHQPIQNHNPHHHHHTHTFTYSKLLRKLKSLLKKSRNGSILNTIKLYKHISSYGISALETIPLALFSFIVASDSRCTNEVSAKLNSADAFAEFSPIERVVFYAISLGGETNKVASMAGALAGAFYSCKDMPRFLGEMCEGSIETQIYAQKLFELACLASTNGEHENENEENNVVVSTNNGPLSQDEMKKEQHE